MTYIVGGVRMDRPFRVRRIGHFGFHSRDIAGTVDFLSTKLGLSLSDLDDFSKRVPGLPKLDSTGFFYRTGGDHHCLVVASQRLVDTMEPFREGQVVNQLSWQIGSLQEVVDGLEYLDKNARLRRIGRDSPGSNWHAYAYDPDGYVNEIYYGMEQIGWDGRSKPECMYDRAFRVKPDLPQMPEYEEVDVALAREGSLSGYRFREQREASYSVDGILMPQPFKLTRLGRVGLYVSDLEASLAFYRDVLGLRVTEYVEVAGHRCAFLRAADEHHTLALYPKGLQDRFGFEATCSFAVANYGQLLAARKFLEAKGVRFLDVPREATPGVRFGFWVQGPDTAGLHIYYGMDKVDKTGKPVAPTALPVPMAEWPQSIEYSLEASFEPPFMGPFA